MAPKPKHQQSKKGVGGSSSGSRRNQQVPRQFTKDEIYVITENLSNVCGEGSYANVYYGMLDDEAVAVKVYQKDLINIAMSEITALAVLGSYPHIIALKGTCICDDDYYIVMPFVPHDLSRRLEVRELGWSYILNILSQLARALQSVKNEDYVIGDLKPNNILIDNDGNAFLCDFGSARKNGLDIPSVNKMYTPKELDKNTNGTPKSDIYSYECILLQMIMRCNDFQQRDFNISIKTEMKNLSSADKGKKKKKAPNSSRASLSPHVSIQARYTMMYHDHVVHKQLIQSGCDHNDAKKISQLGIDCTEDSADDRPCIEQVLSVINELKIN